MDAAANFARGTVSIGYGAGATAIALATGHGARFTVAAPFNCVWWNATQYPDPTDDPNREIVRVTAIAGDVLTLARGQEGTSASAKNSPGKTYYLANVPTSKMFGDIPGFVLTESNGIPSNTLAAKFVVDTSVSPNVFYVKVAGVFRALAEVMGT